MGGSFSHHVSVRPKHIHKALGFSYHLRKGDKQRLEQRSIVMEEDVFPKAFSDSSYWIFANTHALLATENFEKITKFS